MGGGGCRTDNHFIWKIETDPNSFNKSLDVVKEIREEMPVYHPRALRAAFIRRYGSFVGGRTHHLRAMFNDLTNTITAEANLSTQQLDIRLNMALETEDPDIIFDLRELNGNKSDKYSVFWATMQRFLNDKSTVDDRRQGKVTYMAVAFSVRDLVE